MWWGVVGYARGYVAESLWVWCEGAACIHKLPPSICAAKHSTRSRSNIDRSPPHKKTRLLRVFYQQPGKVFPIPLVLKKQALLFAFTDNKLAIVAILYKTKQTTERIKTTLSSRTSIPIYMYVFTQLTPELCSLPFATFVFPNPNLSFIVPRHSLFTPRVFPNSPISFLPRPHKPHCQCSTNWEKEVKQ